MGTQILPVFRARPLLHQRHIILEGHRLSMQAFDRGRFDASCRLPDVKLLLGGVHPARDPLTGQASAHIVIFVIDGELPIGPDRASKGLLIDLHEPAVRINRLWNAPECREGRAGHPWRLVARASVPGLAACGCSGRDTRRFAQRPPRVSLADGSASILEALER